MTSFNFEFRVNIITTTFDFMDFINFRLKLPLLQR